MMKILFFLLIIRQKLAIRSICGVHLVIQSFRMQNFSYSGAPFIRFLFIRFFFFIYIFFNFSPKSFHCFLMLKSFVYTTQANSYFHLYVFLIRIPSLKFIPEQKIILIFFYYFFLELQYRVPSDSIAYCVFEKQSKTSS